MDTEIWVSYHSGEPQNVILILIFFQSFKIIKTILNSQAAQKKAVGWLWPVSCSLPTLDLESWDLRY